MTIQTTIQAASLSDAGIPDLPGLVVRTRPVAA